MKNNIVDFQPLHELEANARLEAFIKWAKQALDKGVKYQLVHSGIRWEMDSWGYYGIKNSSFTAWGANKNTALADKKYMSPKFGDFARAFITYHSVFKKLRVFSSLMTGLRVLEAALYEIKKTDDVTQISPDVCHRATEYLVEKYTHEETLRSYCKGLDRVVRFLEEKKLLTYPIRWINPLPKRKKYTLEDQRRNSIKRLPSPEAIHALGELFNNKLSSPLDIVTVSACALLLCQPGRIGELADVEHDLIVFKEGINGKKRMFLRWFSEKGYGATVKPVVTGMEPVVERVLHIMEPITKEARKYAAWLEDNPDTFPQHDGVPNKGQDDPLTYEEVCSALKLKRYEKHSYRGNFKIYWLDSLIKKPSLSEEARKLINKILKGWDHSQGRRFGKKINGKTKIFYEYDDKEPVTLRILNVLVREKYLPKDFPYTTPPEEGKKRIKYRDALFTVRTGSLPDETKVSNSLPLDFGVEIGANPDRIADQLGSSKIIQSIFERHGYGSLRVNTHAFRHELNTKMHKAGLSQLLIDAFSGRTSRGSTYNHVSIEERTQAVALVHPKTKPSNQVLDLDKIRTNQPLKLSDITELKAGSPDLIIHQTHLGLCTHRFEQEPCPKMGACLSCGNLVCVKGDDVKLANLKEEKDYLEQRYQKAKEAEANGDFGASEWRKKLEADINKCSALIRLLEDPDLEDGSLVWNADNGWNLTNNAAVMSGLIDSKTVEMQIERQKTLPSLNSLAESLRQIED